MRYPRLVHLLEKFGKFLVLITFLASVGFVVTWMFLSLTGCATTDITSCPPCPPVPTPTFVDRPVQQPYPPVTVTAKPDCGMPGEGDWNVQLTWLVRCLALVTQWGEDQHHELESVNAARVTPTPTP